MNQLIYRQSCQVGNTGKWLMLRIMWIFPFTAFWLALHFKLSIRPSIHSSGSWYRQIQTWVIVNDCFIEMCNNLIIAVILHRYQWMWVEWQAVQERPVCQHDRSLPVLLWHRIQIHWGQTGLCWYVLNKFLTVCFWRYSFCFPWRSL